MKLRDIFKREKKDPLPSRDERIWDLQQNVIKLQISIARRDWNGLKARVIICGETMVCDYCNGELWVDETSSCADKPGGYYLWRYFTCGECESRIILTQNHKGGRYMKHYNRPATQPQVFN